MKKEKKRFIVIAVIAGLFVLSIGGMFAWIAAKSVSPYRIAIVIDDLGYNRKIVDDIFAVERPLTLSILPHLQYSAETANLARKKNYESILHLPLEPESLEMRLEQGTILTAMPEGEVIEKFNSAVKSVWPIAGVSNHMGSKATRDASLMRIILSRIKEKKLFFLDSLVVNDSVCEEAARSLDVRFVKRDVFLDNRSDKDYIKAQIEKLAETAIRNGTAVGIGHGKVSTIEAINEVAESLEKRGIKFVFLSEIVEVRGK